MVVSTYCGENEKECVEGRKIRYKKWIDGIEGDTKIVGVSVYKRWKMMLYGCVGLGWPNPRIVGSVRRRRKRPI